MGEVHLPREAGRHIYTGGVPQGGYNPGYTPGRLYLREAKPGLYTREAIPQGGYTQVYTSGGYTPGRLYQVYTSPCVIPVSLLVRKDGLCA